MATARLPETICFGKFVIILMGIPVLKRERPGDHSPRLLAMITLAAL
jgi:hypothetical protein